MNRVVGYIGLALLLLPIGCRNVGLPRIAVEETSPDGAHVAQVRNGPSIDPPNQSLWLADRDGAGATKLRQLSEDQDWCNQIVWSADGSTVAFLVQDARIAIYEARTRRERAWEWLVEHGGYPTVNEVRELELSPDGSVARYRICRRGTPQCLETRGFQIPRAADSGNTGTG